MTNAHCRPIIKQIGAFVDGELTGHERHRVSQHLLECPDCAGLAEEDRILGDTIRLAAETHPASGQLSGLASSVMSRLQAEQAQSWHTMLSRGVEDWRWALVGTGSVTATFISALFVSMVLIAGPTPRREDSLAARFNTLGAAASLDLGLSAEAAALAQSGDGAASRTDEGDLGVGAGLLTENRVYAPRDMVRELADTVTHDGRFIDFGSLLTEDRFRAETLSYDITRMRSFDHMPGFMMRTTASVSAKGL